MHVKIRMLDSKSYGASAVLTLKEKLILLIRMFANQAAAHKRMPQDASHASRSH